MKKNTKKSSIKPGVRSAAKRTAAQAVVITPPDLLEVGSTVLIRTVTMAWTGRITALDEHFVRLEDAAWIADTGRFSTALSTGALNEVEAVKGPVLVGKGSIVDVCHWVHALPRETK